MLLQCALTLLAVLESTCCASRLPLPLPENRQEKAFILAAANNHHQRVASMISQVGTDTIQRAVSEAARLGCVETLRVLLDTGTKFRLFGLRQALNDAVLGDRVRVVEVLVSSTPAWGEYQDHKEFALLKSVEHDHIETFKHLINTSSGPVLNPGAFDVSLIHAATSKSEKIVEFLASGSFSLTTYAKYQAIQEALKNKHHEIADYLIGIIGTELWNELSTKDYASMQDEALIDAAKNDHATTAKYIISMDFVRMTAVKEALFVAVDRKHVCTFRAIVEAMNAALCDAAEYGSAETLRALLNGEFRFQCDALSQALADAVRGDQVEAVEILVSSTHVWRGYEEYKEAALIMAVKFDRVNIFKHLIKTSSGPVLNPGNFDVCLMFAAMHNSQEVVKFLTSGDFNLTKYAKYQAIKEAQNEKYHETANYLIGFLGTKLWNVLSVKSEASIQDKALIDAAKNDHAPIARYIMSKRVFTVLRMTAINNALYHAAANDHLRTFRNIVEAIPSERFGDFKEGLLAAQIAACDNSALTGHKKVLEYIQPIIESHQFK